MATKVAEIIPKVTTSSRRLNPDCRQIAFDWGRPSLGSPCATRDDTIESINVSPYSWQSDKSAAGYNLDLPLCTAGVLKDDASSRRRGAQMVEIQLIADEGSGNQ